MYAAIWKKPNYAQVTIFYSVNVQLNYVTLKIRNIIAGWPGSVNDSKIFNNSSLCAEFEGGELIIYYFYCM